MTSSPNWITDSPFRPCGRDYRTPRRPASRGAPRGAPREVGRHTWGKFKRRFWGESLRRSQGSPGRLAGPALPAGRTCRFILDPHLLRLVDRPDVLLYKTGL